MCSDEVACHSVNPRSIIQTIFMVNSTTLKLLWQSMRPHQWLKNVFILTGLIFGHAFNQMRYVFPVFLCVIAFTLVASAGYIFNDLLDREMDARHPQKNHRPIASGKLSVYAAICWMLSLLFAGLGLGFYISSNAFSLLIAYTLLTAMYSLKLKSIPWVEILCIVTGFVLRILLGTWGVGITPSVWLISCGFLLALFLILAKRRSEQLLFKQQKSYLRNVLNQYKKSGLNNLVYWTAFLCFLVYTFYAVLHGMGFTIILVALGLWRYLFLLQLRAKQQIELDIAHEFFQDSILQIIVVLWWVSVMFHLSQ